MTQRRTECRRCKRPYGEHTTGLVSGLEMQSLCPDGSGNTFLKRNNGNLATSFTDAQIDAAHAIIKRLLMQPQNADLVRHKGFAGLAQKFIGMHKRLAGRKHTEESE